MTETMKTPQQTPPNVNDRNARLKAALQANIARRKAQVKGQVEKPPAPKADGED